MATKRQTHVQVKPAAEAIQDSGPPAKLPKFRQRMLPLSNLFPYEGNPRTPAELSERNLFPLTVAWLQRDGWDSPVAVRQIGKDRWQIAKGVRRTESVRLLQHTETDANGNTVCDRLLAFMEANAKGKAPRYTDEDIAFVKSRLEHFNATAEILIDCQDYGELSDSLFLYLLADHDRMMAPSHFGRYLSVKKLMAEGYEPATIKRILSSTAIDPTKVANAVDRAVLVLSLPDEAIATYEAYEQWRAKPAKERKDENVVKMTTKKIQVLAAAQLTKTGDNYAAGIDRFPRNDKGKPDRNLWRTRKQADSPGRADKIWRAIQANKENWDPENPERVRPSVKIEDPTMFDRQRFLSGQYKSDLLCLLVDWVANRCTVDIHGLDQYLAGFDEQDAIGKYRLKMVIDTETETDDTETD